MLILGIETSCDETGVASTTAERGGLLAHALHSQVAMHEAYGGVVPELASRDHIRRLVPLTQRGPGARRALAELDGIAYTEGPGLAGALLVGAAFAHGLASALGVPGDRDPPPGGPPAVAAALRAAARSSRSSRCWFRAAIPS